MRYACTIKKILIFDAFRESDIRYFRLTLNYYATPYCAVLKDGLRAGLRGVGIGSGAWTAR